ncbi:MAG: hypothetical protein KC431_18530 [Myxococcales bacterium]|nr:hypothetical protein [Myxococcales bacterium]
MRPTPAIALLPLLSLLACNGPEPEPMDVGALCPEIGDPALLQVLEATQEMDPGTPVSGIEYLFASAAGIESLVGIECASDLEFVSVTDNAITDLSPLVALPRLTDLLIDGNPIDDLSPLTGHPTLFNLKLAGCQVDSATALVDMPALANLDLTGNPISTLEGGFTGLDNLRSLRLEGTQIDDLSALEGLDLLGFMTAADTALVDLSSLPTLASLEILSVNDAQLVDAAIPTTQPTLAWLDLSRNQITDLDGLAASNLPALLGLTVDGNPLSSLEPVAAIPGLVNLSMSEVGISDLSALADSSVVYLTARANDIVDLSPVVGTGDLDLADNQIVDVTPLVGGVGARSLFLDNNEIGDLGPLLMVEFETCARVGFEGNPDPKLETVAAQLCEKSVEVVGRCLPDACNPCPPGAEECG